MENSVLFVDFLGWENSETQEPIDGFIRLPFDGMLCKKDEVKFDEDWNLLMLVVEKIRSNEFVYSFECNYKMNYITIVFVDDIGYRKTKIVEIHRDMEFKTFIDGMIEICDFAVKILNNINIKLGNV